MICYISSIYFFHQIFMPSEIQRHFNIHTPFFPHFQIWPFWPQKPKNSNLTNASLRIISNPKWTKRAQDPKSILILAMKLLYTYVWKRLLVGALIWLALIWLIWAQIAQPTSNHPMRMDQLSSTPISIVGTVFQLVLVIHICISYTSASFQDAKQLFPTEFNACTENVYSSRTVSRIDEFWHFLHQITLNLYNFYTQPRGSDYLSTIYFTQENSKLFSCSKPK